jgi:hypothetical protein
MLKTFYFRTDKLSNHKFKHVKVFDAEIEHANIWIPKVELKDELAHFNRLSDNILNFKFERGSTYSRLSNGLVNTHIDILVSIKDKEYVRLFVNLNDKEYKQLMFDFNLTEKQRDPIQYRTLMVASLGIVVSAVFGIGTLIFSGLEYYRNESDSKEQIEIQKSLKELEKKIHLIQTAPKKKKVN